MSDAEEQELCRICLQTLRPHEGRGKGTHCECKNNHYECLLFLSEEGSNQKCPTCGAPLGNHVIWVYEQDV